MEVDSDSGQTGNSSSHTPGSTSEDPVEPNTSQTNTPDVPATSPINKSRYGRTRKPKISEDFYNIDVIFESARELKRSPRAAPQLKSPVSKGIKPQHNQSPLNKPKPNSSVTSKSPKLTNSKPKHFVHVTGDTVVPEAVVLSTSENTSNEIKSPVRKFFKRESLAVVPTSLKESNTAENCVGTESSKQNHSTEVEVCLSSDVPLVDSSLPAVDVTKLLKIISTKSSDPLPNSSEAKGSFKPVLKTYSNKRKHFQKTIGVESFGLPDKPIFPLENDKASASNEPKRIKNLDVAAPSSENDINIVDKKLLDMPWKIASMNTDFADTEILLETSCDEDKNKSVIEMEALCLTKNSKTSSEEFSLPEIKESIKESPKIQKKPEINEVIEDDYTEINKIKKDSPKKQKQVCNEAVPNVESKNQAESSKANKSPRRVKSQNIVRNVTKENQEKELKLVKVRSPRKQKPIISTTDDSKTVKIIALAGRPLRNKSPRKQNQTSPDNNSTVSKTTVEDSETITNKSPRKQKQENLSKSLEIDKSIEIVSAGSSVISLQSVDEPHTRSFSQKRKRSVSPKKTPNVQNQVSQFTPPANQNTVTQTPQRKSLRIQTEALGNLRKKLNTLSSSPLPIKNNDDVSKDFDKIGKSENRKSNLELEKHEMSLKNKSEHPKGEAAVEVPSKKNVSQEVAEIHSTGRRWGKKSTDAKLESAMHNELIEKRQENKSRKEHTSSKLNKMSLVGINSEPEISPVSKKRVLNEKNCSVAGCSTTSELLLEIKEENVDGSEWGECDSPHTKKKSNKDTASEQLEYKQEETKSYENGKSLYDLQIKAEPEDVELGDLMWAKIGGHPYWPCVVSEDPVSKEYKSLKKQLKNYIMSYHVRFFGDKGRRSWVFSSSVIRFSHRNDLKILYDKIKSKTSTASVLQPYIVRPSTLSKWENAVSEAESLKSSTPQQRFDFFFDMFASNDEKKQKSRKTKSPVVKMERTPKTQKLQNISEKEIKQEILDSPPVKANRRKSSNTPKLNVSQKKFKVGLLQATPIKKYIKTAKLIKTEHIVRNIVKVKSPLKMHTRSKSLPLKAFESPSKKNGGSSDGGNENDKLQASEDSEKNTHSFKSVLNEGDNTLRPLRKGMSKSNGKQELESSSRTSLPLQKDVSKFKTRKESRENSIDEPPETFMKNPWQVFDMAKRQLNTPLNEVNSECSLSDTDSHSKSSTNTPIPSTYKDQIARQRRNNLFRGIPRHRVCQVCKKPGEVLKCKGPCNGLFHSSCSGISTNGFSALVMKEEMCAESENSSDGNAIKNEDPKENTKAEGNFSNGIPDTNNLDITEGNNRIEQIKNKSEQSESKLLNSGEEKQKNDSLKFEGTNAKIILDDKAKEEKVPNGSKSITDTSNASNKVEIIHIDCDDSDFEHSLTPKVRLTPSIDFSKLSLAEQIDMKMKEIMQKFEKNTRYADSTTDYTSSEESTSNILPAIPKPKTVQKKKAPKIKHVTADCTSFADNSSSEDLLGEGTSTDLSQEINSSGCSQGVSSTANSEIIDSNRKNSESCLTKIENETINIQKNIAPTAEEFHITGDTAVECEASSDLHSIKEFKCGYCIAETEPPCFVCDKEVSSKDVSFRQKCSLHMCGKFYHPECLKQWPQTQWSLISTAKHKNSDKLLDTFVCPVHVCHTCASDNPHAAISRCTSDKVVKCLRCPATYHTTNYCVPAGTLILSTSQIVCPRHLGQKVIKKGKVVKFSRTINTPWCFICSKGGDLICCETCPTSVHSDCLQINLLEDGTFICEDCETGRFPLYDEIVWVKLGAYRWWPAVILFPNEIPDNVKNIPHSKGEFVVKFFGTHDHYWVHRGRVFLFQEGDRGHCSPTRKRVDALFKKSIEEAAAAHHFKKVFKMNKEAEIRTGMKPPPYIRVKVNKPVGNVRLFDGNISNTTSCECDPNQANPCGPDSDCLNRLLLTECDPNICPAKEKCNNQRFEKRQYPPLVPFKTPARGWGLKTLALIRKGDFVIEYVGEIIDEQEYQRRIHKMHEQKDENYYFLTIDKDRIIDAGPKGNLARFMNHCCHPNCETQKWTVNGDTRVGLFAVEDIPVDAELTFNYNLECIGKEKKICKCGAPNCSGFIGVKAKVDESQKKPKKNNNNIKKKKQPLTPQVTKNDGPCFICGQQGDVGTCHNKICTKFYHLQCVNLEFWPEGKWVCPWHNCNTCSKRTIRCCVKCINSYCPVHSEGNVRYDKLLGFICSEHDPTKESQEIANQNVTTVKNSKTSGISTTEETDVTSTTPDEIDSNLSNQINKSIDDDINTLENPEIALGESVTSTPIKNKDATPFVILSEDYENCIAVDRAEGSNADIPEEQLEEEKSQLPAPGKRKKGRPKRSAGNSPKKIKLSSEASSEAIAKLKRNFTTSNLLDIPAQNEVKLSSSVPTRHLRTTRSGVASTELKRFLHRQSELEKDLPIRKRSRPRCEATL